MMLLLDIGNSLLHWAVCADDKPEGGGQFLHRGMDLLQLADQAWANLPAPDRVVIANVAGSSAGMALADWLQQRWGIAPEFIQASARACGVTNAYPEPERLGVDRWAALVAQLLAAGTVTALTRELALQAGLAAAEEPEAGTAPARWRLCVARESLRAPVLAERLGAALADVLGHPVAVELKPGQPDDTPALREAAARARRQREAEQAITTDPVVVELLDRFPGARIVPGSIKPLDPTH